uniref:Small ribosomal subunit protein uS2c n=1 Tax=Koliella corcontica TaxID=155904 RepID=A0A097KMX6_9CHLO|nr:ribosomal protein S2 [Koliella corcontica]AIT94525.1 ribosomal protein S2 [Koliella corcontica]
MTLTIDEMAQVGMHFGHQARKWNPKMAPYIYTERNGIHIIDLIQTYYHIREVNNFLFESASKGKSFLFVGTKKQASRLVAKTALQCNSFFVSQRWLGGMLTNWKTIKSSINKLNELETLEKNGLLNNLPKKEAAIAKKEKERLQKYLGGLKNMINIPDIVIIIGQTEEINAVLECKKLQLETITILDTDCDPSLANYFIPANDDSVASLQLILNEFLVSIKKGQNKFFDLNKNI